MNFTDSCGTTVVDIAEQGINYNAELDRMWRNFQVEIQKEKHLLFCTTHEFSHVCQYEIECGLSVVRDCTPVVRIVNTCEDETNVSFDIEEWINFIRIIQNISTEQPEEMSSLSVTFQKVSEEICLSYDPIFNCVNLYRADSCVLLHMCDIENIILLNGIICSIIEILTTAFPSPFLPLHTDNCL